MFKYFCDCFQREGTFKETKIFNHGEHIGLCKYCKHFPVIKTVETTESKILKLFKEGYSQLNISKQVGINTSGVRYWLLKNKIVTKNISTNKTQTLLEEL